jgi:Immunoglobulin domain/Putative Ig domain/Ig-like domain CHU_C associated/Bacterial Ig domain
MKFPKLFFPFSFLAFIFTCTSPQNPFTQDKAKVFLHLESSTKMTSDSSITDTAGNIIAIGISYFMPEYFDSVVIMVEKSIQNVDTFFVCRKTDIKADTAWFEYAFKNDGIRTVTATGFVEGGYKPSATASVTVIARPINYKPHLIITGNKPIVAMEACTLFVSASDSDTAQAHSYQVLRGPSGYTFANQIFTWKPLPADTGIDSVTFAVADNGTPVMSDTQTFAIIVLSHVMPINHKPVLVITGRKSITTADVCTLFVSANDEDSTQTLTYKVLKGPQGYTFSNQIFTWKPTATDTGTDTVTFTVTDNGAPPLSDSQKVAIWVSVSIPLPDSIKELIAVSRINGTFVFRWNTSSNADAYAVYRSTDTIGFALYATIPDTFFSNTIKDTAFYYYVKATNSKGSSPASARLHSTSINNAPQWVHDTLQINMLENTSFSLNLADSVSDINGDKITFQRMSGNLTTDSLIGSIWKYSPSFSDSGKYAIKIKASDGIDSSMTVLSIHVANVNRLPVISGIKDTTVSVGVLISLTVSVSDPDGDNVTITADTMPTGATFDPTTKIFSWTPTNSQAGNNKVSFSATDGQSPVKKAITITISTVPLPVITLQPGNQTICSGLPDSFLIAATGTGTLSYQWQKNNVNVPGETNNVIKFSAVSANDSGSYVCIVSNAGGSKPSNPAKLMVNNISSIPTNMTSSFSSVCSGSQDTLKIIGGKLGTNASWKWYTDSACTPAHAAIGTYNSDNTQLIISPTSTTTYYAHAEETCGNTNTVSIKVSVYSGPVAADSISASKTNINPGDTSILKIKGGSLGSSPGTAWKWYSGGCGGSVVGSTFEGTGDSLMVFPTATKAYYARAESGTCGITTCASVKINVMTWTAVSTGLPTACYVRTLIVCGNSIFAGLQNDSGIYLSTNSGVNWTAVNNGLPANTNLTSFGVNGINIFAGTNGTGIYRTTNNGSTWTAANTGIPSNSTINSFAVSGNNIFAGTNTNGIYYSANNGDDWTAINNGIPSTDIFSLTAKADTVFAGPYNNSIYRSTNNGAN